MAIPKTVGALDYDFESWRSRAMVKRCRGNIYIQTTALVKFGEPIAVVHEFCITLNSHALIVN